MRLFKKKAEEPPTQACPRCGSQVQTTQALCPRCAWDLAEVYQGPRVAEARAEHEDPAV
jgi:hypothetical protein